MKEILEKGTIREEIHCTNHFVSYLFLVLRKDGRQRPVINLKELNTFIPYKHFKIEGLHLLNKILQQGDYLCKSELKDLLFLCSIEQTVKKICTFWIGQFSIQIPLSVFWPPSSHKVVYKINKSASIHPSQFVYKNNSIPWRHSNTRQNVEGNNLKQGHCDLPVTESRACYKLKEISSPLNTQNIILRENNRLDGDDSIPASGEGRVDFQNL